MGRIIKYFNRKYKKALIEQYPSLLSMSRRNHFYYNTDILPASLYQFANYRPPHVKSIQTLGSSHKGYINIIIHNNTVRQHALAFLDSGSTVAYDCCLKGQFAKNLNLKISKRADLLIGSASDTHNMRCEGVTSFKMSLEIAGKTIYFDMNCLVLTDLSDNINIGAHFLKKYEVSLIFSKNDPLTLQFKNFGEIQSVGSIDHINTAQVMSAPPTSNALSENSSTSIVDSMIDFNLLKGKIYKLKSSKKQFLSKNTIGQIKCFVDNAPANNYCFLVMPASPFSSDTFEGIIKRVKAQNSEFF